MRALKSTPALIFVQTVFDVEKCSASRQGPSRRISVSCSSTAGVWKYKLFLQLAVLNERIWWWLVISYMLMTLIRSRLQAESWKHSFTASSRSFEIHRFTFEITAFSVMMFILWITRMNIWEMIEISILRWFLRNILWGQWSLMLLIKVTNIEVDNENVFSNQFN